MVALRSLTSSIGTIVPISQRSRAALGAASIGRFGMMSLLLWSGLAGGSAKITAAGHLWCPILIILRSCQISRRVPYLNREQCSFYRVSEVRRAFGLAVRIFRERHGWSQAQLAEASKIDRAYISRIELGNVDPGLEMQRRLVQALGITHTELIAQTEEEERVRRRAQERSASDKS